MSSSIGRIVKCSVFGESHGEVLGCVLDGLPAGEPIDMDEISLQMSRRAPGVESSTPRRESDAPHILSGVLDGSTTGAPLAMVIKNRDARSQDYGEIARLPRPGHADYTAFVRYSGFNDVRGGGHFSGRLTAALVFAGAVCRQILRRRGVHIGGHVLEIHGVRDTALGPVNIDTDLLENLSSQRFAVIDKQPARKCGKKSKPPEWAGTAGGVIEAAAIGLPAGLGSLMFCGVENNPARRCSVSRGQGD